MHERGGAGSLAVFMLFTGLAGQVQGEGREGGHLTIWSNTL